jgi:CBS domain-containing protein
VRAAASARASLHLPLTVNPSRPSLLPPLAPLLPQSSSTTPTPIRVHPSLSGLRVSDLVRARGPVDPPKVVEGNIPVADLLHRLTSSGATSAVLVADGAASSTVRGIFSEKDYVTKLSHGSFPPRDVSARDVASTHIDVARPSTPVTTVLEALLARGRRHAPVLTAAASAGIPSSSSASATAATAGGACAASTAVSSLPVESVDSLLSLRDIVKFAADSIHAAELKAGATEEALKAGKRADDAAAAAAAGGAGGSVWWHSRADDLLTALKAGGSKILLNSRVDDGTTAADAANTMAEKGMSAVAVVGPDGRLVGVFTSRDFITRVCIPGQNATKVKVAEVMSKEVVSAGPDASVLRIARVMVKRGFRHLPVSDAEGKVIGFVSLVDAARALVGQVGATSTRAATGELSQGQTVVHVLPGA